MLYKTPSLWKQYHLFERCPFIALTQTRLDLIRFFSILWLCCHEDALSVLAPTKYREVRFYGQWQFDVKRTNKQVSSGSVTGSLKFEFKSCFNKTTIVGRVESDSNKKILKSSLSHYPQI